MGKPVLHWELWSDNPETVSSFYSKVFDWKIEPLPKLEYQLVETRAGAGINGGILTPDWAARPGSTIFYIDVDDLATYRKRIEEAGGTIIVAEQQVDGMDAFALFSDPDGRVLGIRSLVHAGFWRRFAAWVVDALIVYVPAGSIVLGVLEPALGVEPAADDQIGAMLVHSLAFLFGYPYYAIMESSAWQGTIGKRALGLKVVNAKSGRIHFGQASLRFFGKIVSGALLGLGYLMIAVTPMKQALHDLVAGTFVLHSNSSHAVSRSPGEVLRS